MLKRGTGTTKTTPGKGEGRGSFRSKKGDAKRSPNSGGDEAKGRAVKHKTFGPPKKTRSVSWKGKVDEKKHAHVGRGRGPQ